MGILDKINDETLDRYEKKVTDFRNKAIKLFFGFLKKILGFIPRIIMYSFLVYIFFNIHDRIGFEKTLIILIIGILQFYIYSNRDMKKLEEKIEGKNETHRQETGN